MLRQSGSGGDKAQLRVAVLRNIAQADVTPGILSGNPARTRERYGVAAVDRMNARLVLAALRQSECTFLSRRQFNSGTVTSALQSRFVMQGLMRLARRWGLRNRVSPAKIMAPCDLP